jgi:hypothetical protein
VVHQTFDSENSNTLLFLVLVVGGFGVFVRLSFSFTSLVLNSIASSMGQVAANAVERLHAEAVRALNKLPPDSQASRSDGEENDDEDSETDDNNENANDSGAESSDGSGRKRAAGDRTHRVQLAAHVAQLAVDAAKAKRAATGVAARYAALRPLAIRLWGSEAAVQAGLIEEVLDAMPSKLREQVAARVAHEFNQGHLEAGATGQVVHAGRFVDAEVVGSGDSIVGSGDETYQLVSRFKPSALHPGAAPPPAILVAKRVDVYAHVEASQMLTPPEHHLVPQATTYSFLLVLMKDAERAAPPFEAACKQVQEAALATTPDQVATLFPGLKTVASTARKAAGWCGGRYDLVLDVVRMSFVCASLESVLSTFDAIVAAPAFRIVRVQDTLHPAADPSSSGHRGLTINVQLEGGHIAECRVVLGAVDMEHLVGYPHHRSSIAKYRSSIATMGAVGGAPFFFLSSSVRSKGGH